MTTRTIGFHPAPAGWRAFYRLDDGGIISEPVAGWMLKQGGIDTDEPLDIDVWAAVSAEDGSLMEVSLLSNFLGIRGPGEDDYT